ncbi:hypothetical protein ADUPG1_007726 [Aduncisulcus paluster]|uniref:Uncharacterized protein n=1 Tax=Aduncisulcus paluster TaxID=2918883 RepID=A0ABQ5KPB5_9EUKA|nr:hypothetical protein ADUPG1_007726 [Aduncisulcus paluster]
MQANDYQKYFIHFAKIENMAGCGKSCSMARRSVLELNADAELYLRSSRRIFSYFRAFYQDKGETNAFTAVETDFNPIPAIYDGVCFADLSKECLNSFSISRPR